MSIGGLSVGRAGRANGGQGLRGLCWPRRSGHQSKVAEGTRNTALLQRAFDEAVNAKYVRIRVLSNYKTKADQPRWLLAIAELELFVPRRNDARSCFGSDRSAGTRSARRARSLDDEQALTVVTNAEGLVGPRTIWMSDGERYRSCATPEDRVRTWAENWMAGIKHRTNNDQFLPTRS